MTSRDFVSAYEIMSGFTVVRYCLECVLVYIVVSVLRGGGAHQVEAWALHDVPVCLQASVVNLEHALTYRVR